MEPQINYGGSSFQNPAPYQGQKVYGRSRFAGKGCFGFIGLGILLILIVLGGIYFAYPALTPNSIHGDFMDMVVVPQKDGSQNLWILTDGSFRFVQTTKSPGSYSTGVKCYFCKTWTYVYDPVNEKVIKKIKTEQNDIITKMDLYYSKEKVWEIADGYHENDPRVETYDAASNELVMDTKAFISKYPVLGAGLSTLHFDEKAKTISFNTKDGRTQVIYSLEDDKMYNNQGEYSEAMRNNREQSILAVLGPESSGSKRKKMYVLAGPKGKLDSKKSTVENFSYNESYLKSDSITAEPIGEKSYLEGIIYHQDEDCAIVIHIDVDGRKSNRSMTCVDLKTGKEKWTILQSELFDHMRIDKDKDSFSDLFFTKDKIKVRRHDNLVVVEMKGEGLMGFDYTTGKKLWEMNI